MGSPTSPASTRHDRRSPGRGDTDSRSWRAALATGHEAVLRATASPTNSSFAVSPSFDQYVVLSEESVDDPVRLERRRVCHRPARRHPRVRGSAPRGLGRSRCAGRRRSSSSGARWRCSRPGLLDLRPARGGATGCRTDPPRRVQDVPTCVRRRPPWPARCRRGPDGLRRCQGNGSRHGARRCVRPFGRSVRVGFVCTGRRRERRRITRLEAGGSSLRYNEPNPYLPDLLVSRPEIAGHVLKALRAR